MSRLRPIWRYMPNANGEAAIALDPLEFALVRDRGFALLDGERWNASMNGWDGKVEGDGRIAMRIRKAAA